MNRWIDEWMNEWNEYQGYGGGKSAVRKQDITRHRAFDFSDLYSKMVLKFIQGIAKIRFHYMAQS